MKIEFEVVKLEVADVITTSGELGDNDADIL